MSEPERPFPFFGHAAAVPSRDLDFSVVLAEPPSAAAKKAVARHLKAYGKPTWIGPFASFVVSSRELKAGLSRDPSFDDDPRRLRDPAIFETYGAQAEGMKPLALRLLAYQHERDAALAELNAEHSVAFAVEVQGPRARKTTWHEQSLDLAEQIMEWLAGVLRGPEVQALVAVRDYRRRNYYTSPAKVVLDLLLALVPKATSVKALSQGRRESYADTAAAGLGLSAITDLRLMTWRRALVGLELEAQVDALAEPLRPALRELAAKNPDFEPW